ncbi:NAD(P)/FAD-dependent oxidoreductase [Peptostreptococcus stomatis]
MLRVSNIKIDIDQPIDLVRSKLCKKLRIHDNDIVDYSIYKESIDARKKDQISFVYTVDVSLKSEKKVLARKPKDTVFIETNRYQDVRPGQETMKHQPLVVGAGPAGLFASLLLAQRGYKPILLERGQDVDTRTADIDKFWETGILNNRSNVQFGEGGAGTFSDGKLTTRIKDIRSEKVLREFVLAGAPEDILYSHKPHVGTDILKNVVKNIRQEIIRLGGQVRFSNQLTDINLVGDQIVSVRVNDHEDLACQDLILATGHSARDTYRMLNSRGLHMEQKPFAIGARIEHPQDLINKAQYGKFAGHERLGAADYRLTSQVENGRSVYTFCMCPGGSVIASASSQGHLVTNGMSEHARDLENANSGLLVNVTIDDYGSDHPLAGIDFQEKYEAMAFELGGSNYHAPCQLVGDFLAGRPSRGLASVRPSYRPGVKPTDLALCLPDFVVEAMRQGLVDMDKRLKGFAMPDAVLTGVETRSSAPVRINRDKSSLKSVNIGNLYPCGEGAGYAGGIVTAAVDGIKCAEKIIEKYSPLDTKNGD